MHEDNNHKDNEKTQPNKLFEAIDLRKLVTDPNKLKTADTHIRPTIAYIRKKIKDNNGIATFKDLKFLQNELTWWTRPNEELIKKYEDKGIQALIENADLIPLYIGLTQTRAPIIEQHIDDNLDYIFKYIQAFAHKNRFRFKSAEPKIASNGDASVLYSRLLNQPFPLGEKEIASRAKSAFDYALYVLQKPFPLGERAISKSAKYSFDYARLIEKKFPLGEPAIAKNSNLAFYYAERVLHKPFPLGEPAIAKDGEHSYYYARYVLKKPFPLGEPAIAKSAMQSYPYARNVLEKPFPLGEPVIYDSSYRKDYEKYVLKGKPWTGLKKKKVKEAIDLKNLVSDPEKLKTYKTHISPEEAYERLIKGETDDLLVHTVAKSPEYSYYYALNVLNGPFPLGEPAIRTDSNWSFDYSFDILKGRPWTGLDQKVDEAIDLKKLVSDPTKLKTVDTHVKPNKANARLFARKIRSDIRNNNGIATLEQIKILYKIMVDYGIYPSFPYMTQHAYFIHIENLLKIIKTKGLEHVAKSSLYSFIYAMFVRSRFPLGEPAISKRYEYAYSYALEILKGRFLLAEPSIVKRPDDRLNYAQYVVKGPWPEAEPYISKSTYDSLFYAKEILKGPFPLGEPAIAKDAQYSYLYARRVLKGPFPQGERAIAKDGEFSYYYAKDVLKKPFPLGEPAIYKSSYDNKYESYVLKGKPWTGLPWTDPKKKKKKVKESIDLKNLVSDPKKLKTYDTHISTKEAYRRLKNGETDEYLVRAISKSADFSYIYALNVLNGPFPMGEPAIAKDARYSSLYATDVLKKPFPLGEPEIATDAWNAYAYAKDVLKGPFPLGEPAIASHAYYAYLYAKNVLKGPFLLGEPAMYKYPNTVWKPYRSNVLKEPITEMNLKNLVTNKMGTNYSKYVLGPSKKKKRKNKISENSDQDSDKKSMTPREAYDELVDLFRGKKDNNPDINLLNILITDPEQSFNYAIADPAGPFPLGEPIISTDTKYAYLYATKILKKRFILGEPAIAKDPELSFDYAKNIMKGRFRLGERSIATVPELAVEYSKYILKALAPKKQKK